MKAWQSHGVAVLVGMAVASIGYFQLLDHRPPDELSYDIGYQSGYSDGVEEGAGYEPNPGVSEILWPLLGVVLGVGVIGLVITAIRFKKRGEPSVPEGGPP